MRVTKRGQGTVLARQVRCTLAIIATSTVLITGLGAMPASAETAAGPVQFEDQTQDPAQVNKQMQDEAQKAAKDAVWTPGTIPAEPADADKPAAEPTEWKIPDADRKLSQPVTTQRVPAGTPVGAPGLGALPYMSFEDISLSEDTVARVNLANGNLLLTANDGTSSAAGIGVRADRYYNGLSSSAGALGGGWSSTMSYADFGLTVNSGETEATFVGPSGFQAKFTKSGTDWVAPAGFNATLSKGETWKLTYKETGEFFTFDLNLKRLVNHVDRNGIGLSNDWTTSATTYTVKDTSGRFTRGEPHHGHGPEDHLDRRLHEPDHDVHAQRRRAADEDREARRRRHHHDVRLHGPSRHDDRAVRARYDDDHVRLQHGAQDHQDHAEVHLADIRRQGRRRDELRLQLRQHCSDQPQREGLDLQLRQPGPGDSLQGPAEPGTLDVVDR